jgi:hypothetical protein
MWMMIGLWLGFAPLTSMARIDIRVTQSGSQVDMALMGSVNTNAAKNFRGFKAAFDPLTKSVWVGAGYSWVSIDG